MNGTVKPTRVGTLNLRNLPVDVRDMFKAYCASRGVNMTETIVEFMRTCIREDRIPNTTRKKKEKAP